MTAKPWFLYRRYYGWEAIRRDANYVVWPVRWQGWLLILAILFLGAALFASLALPGLVPSIFGAVRTTVFLGFAVVVGVLVGIGVTHAEDEIARRSSNDLRNT